MEAWFSSFGGKKNLVSRNEKAFLNIYLVSQNNDLIYHDNEKLKINELVLKTMTSYPSIILR